VIHKSNGFQAISNATKWLRGTSLQAWPAPFFMCLDVASTSYHLEQLRIPGQHVFRICFEDFSSRQHNPRCRER
jgi:hypothetical protein